MKTGKYLLLSLMALIAVGFNSCKKDTMDVTKLLSSVPSSASGVVVFNTEELLEDAGCKVKGHEIIPGDEVKGILQNAGNIARQDLMVLFDGTTGIEPRGAVWFYDANRSFLTFSLYDVNKFEEFVEKKSGNKFTENEGVKICGNVAVRDAQAWICLSSGKRIDPDAIKGYASLSDSQSFLVTPMGEKLLVSEDDVRGWAMLNVYMNEILSRSQRSMATFSLGFLFEDAESVKFSVEFSKGEIEAEAMILNSKGKPAKYLLSENKIDVSDIKSLGSSCDALMAFTVNQKMLKKFEKLGNAFGGSQFGDFGEAFKNVDGTVALMVGGAGNENIQGFVTTKGEVNPQLRNVISRLLAPVSQDGKYLRFSKGEVVGSLSVEEIADEFKGCSLGLVTDDAGMENLGWGFKVPEDFRCVFVKLKPESGSMELEIEIETKNKDQSSLLALLRSL